MLKLLLSDIKNMSKPCKFILKYGLAVSSLILTATILLYLTPQLFTNHYEHIHILIELRSYPAVILFICTIAAVCAEDIVRH